MNQHKIAIISPFPPEGGSSVPYSALATYSQTWIKCLSAEIQQQIVVLAQKEGLAEYVWQGVPVLPTWTRTHFQSFKSLRQHLRGHAYELVHLQYENFAYGGILSNLRVVALLRCLRRRSTKVVVTIHGVVPLSSLDSNYMRLAKGRMPRWLLRIGLRWTYRQLTKSCESIIVHESALKQVLINDYGADATKIKVVPHPLHELQPNKHPYSWPEETAKEPPDGARRILVFGYLSPYKGFEVLFDALESVDLAGQSIWVHIVGDVPLSYQGRSAYQAWLQSMQTRSQRISSRITWDQRFVSDAELADLFTRADLVVIPRVGTLSTSGPFTYAIQTQTPVLLSSAYQDDVAAPLIFGSSASELARQINRFFQDAEYQREIQQALLLEREKRSAERIGRLIEDIYQEVITG